MSNLDPLHLITLYKASSIFETGNPSITNNICVFSENFKPLLKHTHSLYHNKKYNMTFNGSTYNVKFDKVLIKEIYVNARFHDIEKIIFKCNDKHIACFSKERLCVYNKLYGTIFDEVDGMALIKLPLFFSIMKNLFPSLYFSTELEIFGKFKEPPKIYTDYIILDSDELRLLNKLPIKNTKSNSNVTLFDYWEGPFYKSYEYDLNTMIVQDIIILFDEEYNGNIKTTYYNTPDKSDGVNMIYDSIQCKHIMKNKFKNNIKLYDWDIDYKSTYIITYSPNPLLSTPMGTIGANSLTITVDDSYKGKYTIFIVGYKPYEISSKGDIVPWTNHYPL